MKAPKNSVRDQLRALEQHNKNIIRNNRDLWRFLLAILSEAEGKVEITLPMFNQPEYDSFTINYDEGLITLNGVKTNEGKPANEGATT